MNKYMVGIIGMVALTAFYLNSNLDKTTAFILLMGIAGLIMASEEKKG